jgi:hypothetical protein
MLLLLLALVAVSSGLVYKPAPHLSTRQAFDEYVVFWNKTYTTIEKMVRYRNFVEAGQKIQKLNADSNNARFGYTQFADWSYGEFKKLNGFIPSKPLPEPRVVEKRAVHQSSPINWVAKGMTTPIKNQGQCGSCWAFSATETVESADLLCGRPMTIGSPQEIVDCDNNDDGCGGGDPREALGWVVQQGGLDTASCYPYVGQDQQCMSNQCSPSPNLRISTVTPVPGDEGQMYNYLTRSPLSICCDAAQWQYYEGGILTASQCGQSIDHAIQLVGYSPNSGGYWIVRNSWGASWGENGYIYLEYGTDTCGITYEVTGASC